MPATFEFKSFLATTRGDCFYNLRKMIKFAIFVKKKKKKEMIIIKGFCL